MDPAAHARMVSPTDPNATPKAKVEEEGVAK